MKKIFFSLLAVGSLTLLTACSLNAGGPRFQGITPLPSNRAGLYVYRPYQREGSALAARVRLNGRLLGNLKTAGYLFTTVKPGRYTITAAMGERAFGNYGQTVPLRIQIKAQQQYFVRLGADVSRTAVYRSPLRFRTPLPAWKPVLARVPMRTAISELRQLRYSKK